jgi:hypothetical protein
MRKIAFLLCLAVALPIVAQSEEDSFEKFRQQQAAQFNQFRDDQQAEYDKFRKRVNEEYAEFMRRAWQEFEAFEADVPQEEKTVEPVYFEEPEPAPQEPAQPSEPTEPTEPSEEPAPVREDISALPTQQPVFEPQPIAVKPVVIVIPEPAPTPEPIAPVEPKEEPFKRVSVSYYGALITIGFPETGNLQLKGTDENAIADGWQALSDSRYDITVKTALDARKANALCDWSYMDMLRNVCEKQYGKTNEATLAQAFLMVQSGYRIRLGNAGGKLQLLVASLYDIYGYKYFVLDGMKFYIVSGDKNTKMHICESKYGKEKSLSMQIARLPKFTSNPTPKRTLTSKKGVTAATSVNKNLIDFFNTYPQACYKGDYTTRWAAYANTPLDKSIQNALYPSLKKTIDGMSERQAVELLLNWVQTAFVYKVDDDVWGHDRAFFAQETLYYPYCDCEDRAILFSRLVRDLVGLDVVLLYYPGHLASAVAFNTEERGDYLTYKNRRYIVCDPTYINAGVGRTMPGMNNQEAQVIALK